MAVISRNSLDIIILNYVSFVGGMDTTGVWTLQQVLHCVATKYTMLYISNVHVDFTRHQGQ